MGGFHALRRQVEGPSQYQCQRKADRKQHDDHRTEPVRKTQGFIDDIDNLHDQPGHDDVDGGYLEDISAFEFGDQCDACKKMYCEGCLENMESGPGFVLCDECEITFLCGCPESANRFEDFWAGCCLISMYGEPGCGAKLCPHCDDVCRCIKDDDYEYFSDDDLDMRFD